MNKDYVKAAKRANARKLTTLVDEELARVCHKPRHELVVSLRQYTATDHPFKVDIREHVTEPTKAGGYTGPTRAGISVEVEQLYDLMAQIAPVIEGYALESKEGAA
jgi:hypothetical protein